MIDVSYIYERDQPIWYSKIYPFPITLANYQKNVIFLPVVAHM